MYGQLINGVLRIAPKKVAYGDNIIYNPPGEVYEALGYYPITYTDMPDDAPDGYHYESAWEQIGEQIVEVWHLEEDSDEISDDEALGILMGVEE